MEKSGRRFVGGEDENVSFSGGRNFVTQLTTENPNLEDYAPPHNDHPPTAQWEHGRGLQICPNPGLVMTTGAIVAIFDIPSIARAIEEKPICSFAGKMVVFPQFLSSDVEIRKSPRWPP